MAITWSAECLALLDSVGECSLDIVIGWPVLMVGDRYFSPLEWTQDDDAPMYSEIIYALRELRKRFTVRFEVTPLGRHVLAIRRGEVTIPDEA